MSVYDKAGLVELGKGLSALGYELLSTGGSATALAAASVAVTQVDVRWPGCWSRPGGAEAPAHRSRFPPAAGGDSFP